VPLAAERCREIELLRKIAPWILAPEERT